MTEHHRKKAAVLISGNGSNLQAFIDQIANGQLNLDISLVISNKQNAYGLERAKKANIATAVIDNHAFSSRLEFDCELIKHIDSTQADVVILAGFMRILSAHFVEHYAGRLLNIHPSLLPLYPGTNTHQKVLNNRDQWHGASVHFVTAEVDAGPIILQGKMPVLAHDDISSLQQRIHKIEHIIYPEAVRWFIQNRLSIRNGTALLDNEISDRQLQSFD